MIESGNVFTHLEKCNIYDLRRILYLSRKEAWVNIGDVLYKLSFINRIKTITHQAGAFTYFHETSHPVSPDDDFDLKLRLSRVLTSLITLEKNSSTAAVDLPYLGQLSLNPIAYEFSLLCFITGSDKTTLQMRVENYDHLFIKKFINSPQENKAQLAKNYQYAKLLAMRDAVKNEIWLYAGSGDAMELAVNLTPRRQFLKKAVETSDCSFMDRDVFVNNFLRETYRSQSVIQAMFRANPKKDLPFSDIPANYSNALTVLLDTGQFDLDIKFSADHSGTVLDFCKQYRRQKIKFFHFTNKVHTELFAVLDKRFDLGSEHHVACASTPALDSHSFVPASP